MFDQGTSNLTIRQNSSADINAVLSDIVITSLEWAKEAFLDKDLSDLNEKKSLLEALWLYADDNSDDDETKIHVLEILRPVYQRLSDEDIRDVFPKIYTLLFPDQDN